MIAPTKELRELLEDIRRQDPRDEDGDSELGYYERQYTAPVLKSIADKLQAILDECPAFTQSLREETEQCVLSAYVHGWQESKRWPNHPQAPHVEVVWTEGVGMEIAEDHSRRMGEL